jgi:O-antigen/teichoic acid export membrane protein
MFLATPFLIRYLGIETFGLWMLVAAFVSSWGVVNLGVAPTTTRFVAVYRDEVWLSQVKSLIQAGLAWALLGGGLAGGALALGSGWLANNWLKNMGSQDSVKYALVVASMLLLLAQVEFTYKAAIKGFELFGLVARLELVSKSALVLTFILVAYLGMGLSGILSAMLIFSVINCLIYGLTLSELLGRGIWLPMVSKTMTTEIRSFAGWNWMQILSSVFFSQFDRFLIGAVMGANSLAVYSVCLQIAQQIHALPAALFSVILPIFSRRKSNSRSNLKIILYGVVVSLSLAIPIILFSDLILELWMGNNFSNENKILLMMLAGSYLLLSINVVPHFLNLVSGNAKFISLLNMFGGIVSILSAVSLIDEYGFIGLMFGKLTYGLILTIGNIGLGQKKI